MTIYLTTCFLAILTFVLLNKLYFCIMQKQASIHMRWLTCFSQEKHLQHLLSVADLEPQLSYLEIFPSKIKVVIVIMNLKTINLEMSLWFHNSFQKFHLHLCFFIERTKHQKVEVSCHWINIKRKDLQQELQRKRSN